MGRNKIPLEEYKEWLANNTDIEYVSGYSGIRYKCQHKCKKCGYEWSTKPDHIKRGTKCPKCSKITPLNEYKEWLANNTDIEYVSGYSSIKYKCQHKCKKCGHEWSTTPNSIKNNGTRCPKCSKMTPLDEYKEWLANNTDIEYVSGYSGIKYKCRHKCKKCGHEWSTTPSNIRCNGTRCPKCNMSHLEKLVNSILQKMCISFEIYPKFDWLGSQNFDAYIPSLNLGIESQGIGHFRPVERFGGEDEYKITCDRDARKLKLSKENGVDIIYFIDPSMAFFSDIPSDVLLSNGYMGETIVQSKEDLYNKLKSLCTEKGIGFTEIPEFETVYKTPGFSMI